MKTYTKEQFLSTKEPYEFLRKMRNDPLRHEQALAAIKDNAHAVGVKNFNSLYAAYITSLMSGQASR